MLWQMSALGLRVGVGATRVYSFSSSPFDVILLVTQ